jgi:hypothetical protein
MKITVAVISLMCICCLSNAQENNQMNKMINESLSLYINWKSDITNESVRDRENSIPYICLDNYPATFSVLDEELKKKVKFMSLYNLSGQRELQRNIEYDFIFPEVFLDNNQIRITIFGKKASISRRKQLHIWAVERCVFTYVYSCDRQEWKLMDTVFEGI